MVLDKRYLRNEILFRRDNLSPEQRATLSMQIWARLTGLKAFDESDTILFYASFRSEVETWAMMEACRDLGKQVVLPRVDLKTETLSFYQVEKGDEMESGAYGIMEPPR